MERKAALRVAAHDITSSEAPLTPSDAPAGTLPPAGTDAFPPTAPHAVRAYARQRWSVGLARWWRAAFSRNAYARTADTSRSHSGGHHFFQHLIEDGDDPAPGDAVHRP
jgi:hypothetical protein